MKKWKVTVRECSSIVYAEDEEKAMEAFIDGYLDFGDFEFEDLGEVSPFEDKIPRGKKHGKKVD